MKKRVWLFGLLVAVATQGQAQAAKAAPWSHVGVIAVLGDAIDVVMNTDAPTDTRIERLSRSSREVRGLDIDVVAAQTAASALRAAKPGVQITLLRSPVPLSVDQQRELAEGARQGGLSDWMVRAIDERKFSHVLLISRTRGDINARTEDGVAIGRGRADGVGFYVDTFYTMRNRDTGALSTGLIAPYAKLHLQLMDTQTAQIVWHNDVDRGAAYAAPNSMVQADPWSFMSDADKIRSLRSLVAEGVRGAMTKLDAP
ncbi:hypothetical protein [Inhella sp.]|uniref:hypothetical protein n=1 Tax=Inhella sp. TaxID=1921806 RepID=UPI0035AF9466